MSDAASEILSAAEATSRIPESCLASSLVLLDRRTLYRVANFRSSMSSSSPRTFSAMVELLYMRDA